MSILRPVTLIALCIFPAIKSAIDTLPISIVLNATAGWTSPEIVTKNQTFTVLVGESVDFPCVVKNVKGEC